VAAHRWGVPAERRGGTGLHGRAQPSPRTAWRFPRTTAAPPAGPSQRGVTRLQPRRFCRSCRRPRALHPPRSTRRLPAGPSRRDPSATTTSHLAGSDPPPLVGALAFAQSGVQDRYPPSRSRGGGRPAAWQRNLRNEDEGCRPVEIVLRFLRVTRSCPTPVTPSRSTRHGVAHPLPPQSQGQEPPPEAASGRNLSGRVPAPAGTPHGDQCDRRGTGSRTSAHYQARAGSGLWSVPAPWRVLRLRPARPDRLRAPASGAARSASSAPLARGRGELGAAPVDMGSGRGGGVRCGVDAIRADSVLRRRCRVIAARTTARPSSLSVSPTARTGGPATLAGKGPTPTRWKTRAVTH